jgi:hypothetical protein
MMMMMTMMMNRKSTICACCQCCICSMHACMHACMHAYISRQHVCSTRMDGWITPGSQGKVQSTCTYLRQLIHGHSNHQLLAVNGVLAQAELTRLHSSALSHHSASRFPCTRAHRQGAIAELKDAVHRLRRLEATLRNKQTNKQASRQTGRVQYCGPPNASPN